MSSFFNLTLPLAYLAGTAGLVLSQNGGPQVQNKQPKGIWPEPRGQSGILCRERLGR
jgi:hypothetical protein